MSKLPLTKAQQAKARSLVAKGFSQSEAEILVAETADDVVGAEPQSSTGANAGAEHDNGNGCDE